MPNIYLPATSAADWQRLLADPVKHWRTGYSARTMAHCWQATDGFPPSVTKVLTSSNAFPNLALLLAIPEHKVPLPGGSRPSQNDVWALARCDLGLLSIAVEGKAAEPFGPTLAEWRTGGLGKQERLAFLLSTLGLTNEPAGEVRYQLLHRAASAVIEAKRFFAPYAVMLVHAFGENQIAFADYQAFAALFGQRGERDQLLAVGQSGGVSLYLGWASGEDCWLSA